MTSLLEYLTDPSQREVPYGPGKRARYQGAERWQVFYAVPGRAPRPERLASTADVLAKQGSNDFNIQHIERIVEQY